MGKDIEIRSGLSCIVIVLATFFLSMCYITYVYVTGNDGILLVMLAVIISGVALRSKDIITLVGRKMKL